MKMNAWAGLMSVAVGLVSAHSAIGADWKGLGTPTEVPIEISIASPTIVSSSFTPVDTTSDMYTGGQSGPLVHIGQLVATTSSPVQNVAITNAYLTPDDDIIMQITTMDSQSTVTQVEGPVKVEGDGNNTYAVFKRADGNASDTWSFDMGARLYRGDKAEGTFTVNYRVFLVTQ